MPPRKHKEEATAPTWSPIQPAPHSTLTTPSYLPMQIHPLNRSDEVLPKRTRSCGPTTADPPQQTRLFPRIFHLAHLVHHPDTLAPGRRATDDVQLSICHCPVSGPGQPAPRAQAPGVPSPPTALPHLRPHCQSGCPASLCCPVPQHEGCRVLCPRWLQVNPARGCPWGPGRVTRSQARGGRRGSWNTGCGHHHDRCWLTRRPAEESTAQHENSSTSH